jgi:hypothetical protein
VVGYNNCEEAAWCVVNGGTESRGFNGVVPEEQKKKKDDVKK